LCVVELKLKPMENAPSDKDKFRQALEAYAVALGTGNGILVQTSGMLVEQYLSRLPDQFSDPEPAKAVEVANTEPGGMP
jgi:hypothetical protein